MQDSLATLSLVKDYYGKVLRTSSDLKTSACCPIEALPTHIAQIVDQIQPEIRARFYGCGVIAPAALEGRTVLDLGCGTGRDVYVLSKLVGEHGKVIGVDMTAEQLDVGRRYQAHQAQAFGHKTSNVKFIQGYIEDLESLGIATASVDLVVSNCVINLSPAKERVFAEIFRVLKPGGELHFSDVFSDRRLPASFMHDQVLLGECLGGAMYIEDCRRLLARLGCNDPRSLGRSKITLTAPEIAAKVGRAQFSSYTLRAFKLALEDRCEDFGQVATYLGTMDAAPHAYALDDHHLFEARRPLLVCSNTAKMLTDSRLAPHFQVTGDTAQHFGLFPCGPQPGSGEQSSSGAAASCC